MACPVVATADVGWPGAQGSDWASARATPSESRHTHARRNRCIGPPAAGMAATLPESLSATQPATRRGRPVLAPRAPPAPLPAAAFPPAIEAPAPTDPGAPPALERVKDLVAAVGTLHRSG